MTKSIEILILTKIKKAKRGSLFFGDSFSSAGNVKAINKALERLVKKGEIIRVAQGIYVRPAFDPVVGQITPTIDAIAKAIAKRDKARIIPTGVYALNQLGLSTQVPMNVVFLTDGAARKIDIAGRKITFKKTTPKNVAAIGEISKLVIQALRSIGSAKATPEEILQIQNLLRKEKPTHLEHDFYLAPAWIKEIMRPILKELKK
jgi:hypothetical protein